LWWLFIFIWFFIFLRNNEKTKIYFDYLLLRIPFFWWLIKRKILVSFSRTLWTLLNSWVLINKSLEITKKSLENDYYEKELDKIISWIWKWKALSDLMWIGLLKQKKESFYFPIELASVIRIWEQTGKTPELLLKVSEKFKKELDTITKNIQAAIEPVVIIFVWWIIWTIIMAILMPFFNMVNVVG
jgi:type IV pilus assembly protein PilC